jgi:hypothetical protein
MCHLSRISSNPDAALLFMSALPAKKGAAMLSVANRFLHEYPKIDRPAPALSKHPYPGTSMQTYDRQVGKWFGYGSLLDSWNRSELIKQEQMRELAIISHMPVQVAALNVE